MLDIRFNPPSTNRWIFAGCLALALAAAGTAGAQAPSGPIVVFGTSLSDPGNAFALRGGTNTPPDYSVDPFLVPDAPYARGGHHFSDGATWIEQFARPLGRAASVRPAFLGSSAGAANYAVGGARAHEPGGANLSVQVDTFLHQAGGAAPSDGLYVVEMGGNDVRDALVAGGGDALAIIVNAIEAISINMTKLHAAGARKFLVWNAPDLGLTPAILGLDRLSPGAAAGASFLSQTFNYYLAAALAGLEARLEGISIRRLDAFGKLHAIVNQPQNFGLSEVQAACITPSVAPFACTNADEYLFWDGIHPTGAAHALIAHEAAAVLMH